MTYPCLLFRPHVILPLPPHSLVFQFLKYPQTLFFNLRAFELVPSALNSHSTPGLAPSGFSLNATPHTPCPEHKPKQASVPIIPYDSTPNVPCADLLTILCIRLLTGLPSVWPPLRN